MSIPRASATGMPPIPHRQGPGRYSPAGAGLPEGVLVAGAGLDLAPAAIEHVLTAADELSRAPRRAGSQTARPPDRSARGTTAVPGPGRHAQPRLPCWAGYRRLAHQQDDTLRSARAATCGCAYPGTGAGTPQAAGLQFVILRVFLIAAGRVPGKGAWACYQALMISGGSRAREPVVTVWGLRDD